MPLPERTRGRCDESGLSALDDTGFFAVTCLLQWKESGGGVTQLRLRSSRQRSGRDTAAAMLWNAYLYVER